MKNQEKMTAQSAVFGVELNTAPCRKVDSVILTIPFTLTCKEDLMKSYEKSGIHTCVDYLTRKFLLPTMSEGGYCIVNDIFDLIKGIAKGEIETSMVVCAQCHGLPQKVQELLMCGVLNLHKLGISVIFVKDGIEFRANEETTSVIRRSLQHIGRYSDFISFISKTDKNTSGDNGEDA